MASTYELIETTTLTSSASSVTFSSITQDYRDLVLVSSVIAGSSNFELKAQFNSDSGSNYARVYALAFSGGELSGSATTTYNLAGATGTSSHPSCDIFQILDYSQTDKHKSSLTRRNIDAGTLMEAGRWANTSAITSIVLSAAINLESGSTFSLYGIAS